MGDQGNRLRKELNQPLRMESLARDRPRKPKTIKEKFQNISEQCDSDFI
jgi:hypothetical protein